MTSMSVSNLSVQSSLVTALQAEQTTLTSLTTQLSTQQKHDNLTDYSASDARNLINLQSTATQKQAYLSVIDSVNTKLSVYDTTLTDLETIVSQAQSLSTANPNYSAATASNIAIQAGNYLKSVGVDLNQQLNGQYIYAGTRYTTAPVGDLSNLPTSTLSSTLTTSPALPSYDSQYAASALTTTIAGQTVTIGGTVGTPQDATVNVNGTDYTYAIQASDTPTTIATALAALVPGASSAGAVLTVPGGDTINSASAYAASNAAYSTDSATVDTGYTLNYGISSDSPAMQQLVAGLRYLQAAGNATDSATYKSNITQASTLLTSALSGLQGIHTTVAYNINTMTNEKAAQNTAITDLTNQVADIQQVDVTQVSAEITELQTILQASYSVTGSIEKLSIVSYL